MLNVFNVFSIAVIAFTWICLLYTITLIIIIIPKLAKGKSQIKNIIILTISILYILSFILGVLFLKDLLYQIMMILFVIVLIATTQFTKYEDRKMGKRWWTK